MGQEKRVRRRYRVRDFQVEYTTDNLFSFFSSGGTERQPLVDMSSGGLQFLAQKQLKIGDVVKLTVSAPIFASPIKLRGRVAWCQQIPRQTLFRTGVRFDPLDDEAAHRIIEFEEKVQELSIRVLCNSCGSAFKVKKRHEGAKGRCPNCSKVIEIVEALPQGDQARSGIHVAAAAVDAGLSEGAGVDPATGTVSDKVIPVKVQRFLLKTVPTRVHLAIIEHLQNTRATVASPQVIAQAVGEGRSVTIAACMDLVNRRILKAVGTKAFNYAPPDDLRAEIEDLVKLSRDRRRRAAVLAFVLANEKR